MSDSDAADGAGTDGDERVVGVVGTTADAPTAGVALELAARRGGALVASVRGRGPTLRDVCAGRAAPREAVRSAEPVALVPRGRPLAAVEDERALRDALSGIAAAGGSVVVDCGQASAAGGTVAVADACVVVAAGTVAGVVGAVDATARARALGVLVAAVAYAGSGAVPPGFSRALGAPSVTVPTEGATRVAHARGCPVEACFPESGAGGAFDALAGALD